MRFAVLALCLLALAPALPRAQTCGGLLSFGLGAPTPGRPDSLRALAASQLDVVAAAVAPPMSGQRLAPVVTGRPALDVLARRTDLAVQRDTLTGARDGLFWPRDELTVWTRCGFVLLRYEITRYDGRHPAPVMTLDLYNVPPHVGVEADGRIPFRAGRWSFDFAGGDPFTAASLRREPG